MGWGCELVSSDSGWGPKVDSYEDGYESSDFVGVGIS
jgi:hypothetical protein